MKRFAPLFLAFACGVAVCWVYRDTQTRLPRHEYPDLIDVSFRGADGKAESYRVRPFMVSDASGDASEIGRATSNSQPWRVTLWRGEDRCTLRAEPVAYDPTRPWDR